MKLENTKAQMKKGILELCVLSIISDKEMYPSDIITQLKKVKMIVVEGTLYPLLNRLLKADLLSYSWKESKTGPPRKYYKVTETGAEFKNELVDTWKELNSAVNSSINKKK
ncbi:MAG: PadR family transcriptional regulator [Saprospiraceae bacterium]|nr:PadR family transcriptional regulator [Saprospiraceae bacterium]